jgi:tetratricopeptide (TPR) repeat protein
MKTLHFRVILFLLALLMGLQAPGFSQQAVSASEFNPDDSPGHGKLISTYREFFKWKEYDQAMDSWWTLFKEYPDVSERLYVDGVTMYRQFIEEAPEGPSRINKVDTLMLIYDQRIEYFGGEGNILGRKGSDLLRYRSSDKDQVQAAYDMLKTSLESEGTKSREPVVRNFVTAGLILQQQEVIDNTRVMEDYFMVSGLLDELEGSSSRWKRTRDAIDEMILKADILSCVGLDLYFGTRFDQNSEDRELLEKMITYYTSTDCKQSDLYTAASEKLFELDPGPESAHNLAILFIGKEDLEKAARYLLMAVVGEDIEDETRAEWFYELSIVTLANGDHCGAINYARQALAYKNDLGKAYLALGDAFITARKELGEDIQQRCAYWAAADMYQLARSVDPGLSKEVKEKLSLCSAQYPLKEDLFFHELQNGDRYQVEGCIQANTTVRSRD